MPEPTAATLPSLRGSPRAWWQMSATSVAVWSIVAAFIAKSCIPRSVDLLVYRDAARTMLHGGATYLSSFTTSHLPFTYPPFALFAFSPLTAMSSTGIAWVWDVVNIAALALTLAVVVRQTFRASWSSAVVVAGFLGGASCLALEPLRSSLLDGQVNFLLLAIVVVDLLAVPAWGRGALVGFAGAVKLTPLVFVVYLLSARERGAAVRALVAFGVATTIGWIVLPADSITFWFHQAFSPGHRGASTTVANQSWWGLLSQLPRADGALHAVAWLCLVGTTVAAGGYVARRHLEAGRRLTALIAVAVTGDLVSPISWTHHWCWIALLPLALLADRGGRGVTIATLGVLAVAVLAPYGWHLTGTGSIIPGFSLVFAGAALLAAMTLDARRRHAALRASEAPVLVASSAG